MSYKTMTILIAQAKELGLELKTVSEFAQFAKSRS